MHMYMSGVYAMAKYGLSLYEYEELCGAMMFESIHHLNNE